MPRRAKPYNVYSKTRRTRIKAKPYNVFSKQAKGRGPTSHSTSVGKATQVWRNPRKPRTRKG